MSFAHLPQSLKLLDACWSFIHGIQHRLRYLPMQLETTDMLQQLTLPHMECPEVTTLFWYLMVRTMVSCLNKQQQLHRMSLLQMEVWSQQQVSNAVYNKSISKNTQHLGKNQQIMVSAVGCVKISRKLYLYHTHTVASVPFSAVSSYCQSIFLQQKIPTATDQWNSSCSYAVYIFLYCSFLLIYDKQVHIIVCFCFFITEHSGSSASINTTGDQICVSCPDDGVSRGCVVVLHHSQELQSTKSYEILRSEGGGCFRQEQSGDYNTSP